MVNIFKYKWWTVQEAIFIFFAWLFTAVNIVFLINSDSGLLKINTVLLTVLIYVVIWHKVGSNREIKTERGEA